MYNERILAWRYIVEESQYRIRKISWRIEDKFVFNRIKNKEENKNGGKYCRASSLG